MTANTFCYSGAQRPFQKYNNTDRIKQEQKSSHYELLIRKPIHIPQSILLLPLPLEEGYIGEHFRVETYCDERLSNLAVRLKSFKWIGKKPRLWARLSSCMAIYSEHASLFSPQF